MFIWHSEAFRCKNVKIDIFMAIKDQFVIFGLIFVVYGNLYMKRRL